MADRRIWLNGIHVRWLTCSAAGISCTGSNRLSQYSCGNIPYNYSWYVAKICHKDYDSDMSTMNISLPDGLKAFVDEQVARRGYGTISEYVRELIRRDQERTHLRNLLLEGVASGSEGVADAEYFEGLRDYVRRRTDK